MHRGDLAEKLLRAPFPSEDLPELADVAPAHGIGGMEFDGAKKSSIRP